MLISSSALNTSRLIGSTRMLELCSSVNNITWQLAFSKLATLHVVQREQSSSSILIRRSNVLTYTHMNLRADSASLRNIKYSPSTPHAHSQVFICACEVMGLSIFPLEKWSLCLIPMTDSIFRAYVLAYPQGGLV